MELIRDIAEVLEVVSGLFWWGLLLFAVGVMVYLRIRRLRRPDSENEEN